MLLRNRKANNASETFSMNPAHSNLISLDAKCNLMFS